MMSNYAYNRDHLNDAELGTGIYDKSIKPVDKLPRLCECGKPIENPWYGDEKCYDCQREERAMQEQEWGALEILVGYIPPEPEAQAAEIAADQEWTDGWNADASDLGESPTETRSMIDF
jgi:hypothetical protein